MRSRNAAGCAEHFAEYPQAESSTQSPRRMKINGLFKAATNGKNSYSRNQETLSHFHGGPFLHSCHSWLGFFHCLNRSYDVALSLTLGGGLC